MAKLFLSCPKQISSRVSICAPASPVSKQEFLKGVKRLESMGIKTVFSREIFRKNKHLAGPDEVRAQTFLHAIKESDIILSARGGSGCGRLFPLVKNGIKALSPFTKTFIGSSDLTFLYLFFQKLSPQFFAYGPMVCRYGTEDFGGFERRVIEETVKGILPFPLRYPDDFFVEKDGDPVQGKLDGGNLSILVSSMGTPYEWTPKGTILYIEDINEPLYRIDRMLTQLNHAGKFKKTQAVLVGKMPVSGRTLPYKPFRECLLEHFSMIDGPVITKMPTGHGKTQWPFFLGGTYSVGGSILCLSPGGKGRGYRGRGQGSGRKG